MEPQIRYARTTDEVSIAYAQAGEGPDLVCVPFIGQTHAQQVWAMPWAVQPMLADHFRVLHYDSRGSGLSQRDALDFSIEAMVRDLEAVVERAGLDQFVLFAYWDGVPVAIRYATVHPERVSRLVLSDGYAQFADYRDGGVPEIERALRDKDWVLLSDTIARVLSGLKVENQDSFARYLRASTTQESWMASQGAMMRWDVKGDLAQISCPTLVIHTSANLWLPVESGQRLAAAIPDAEFRLRSVFEYDDVIPMVTEFCGIGRSIPAHEKGPALQTILFTDVEGSTALTDRLGDAAAREVMREHERITREALKAHGGSEVKTMGDGFMASFGSASRALECAVAVQWNMELGTGNMSGVRVRVGLNAGEPIAEEGPDGRGDLFGTAVIVAARIAAQARGGEILVSDVVRQLVAGKGFLFNDRGEHVLRGFEDPVRVFEVRWSEGGS